MNTPSTTENLNLKANEIEFSEKVLGGGTRVHTLMIDACLPGPIHKQVDIFENWFYWSSGIYPKISDLEP